MGARLPREDPETSCNGEDDDCDGMVDEGLGDVFYRDSDGDGEGDARQPMNACSLAAGYVPNSDDCDDECASCNAGGTEVCDGRDNNCDGLTDELLTVTVYMDADGDGYGTGGVRQGCPGADGFAPRDGDCDDDNARRHPDAPFSSMATQGGYDFNCDGDEELEFEAFDDLDAARAHCVDCPVDSSRGHYLGAVSCGDVDATTFTCVAESGRCVVSQMENQTVRCR